MASPDRSAADRTNDQRRKPAEMLAFIGIAPGITALDLSAGGGYTTELLARSIGPTGTVYGQSRPRDPSQPAPTPPPRPKAIANPTAAAPAPHRLQRRPHRRAAASLAGRARRPRRQAEGRRRRRRADHRAWSRPFEDPVPAELADGRLDLVTLMFNYHDLGFLGVDRAAMNRRSSRR